MSPTRIGSSESERKRMSPRKKAGSILPLESNPTKKKKKKKNKVYSEMGREDPEKGLEEKRRSFSGEGKASNLKTTTMGLSVLKMTPRPFQIINAVHTTIRKFNTW